MSKIFSAKLTEGYALKVIFELIKSTCSKCNLEINEKNIFTFSYNKDRTFVVLLTAKKVNFLYYTCKEEKTYTLAYNYFYEVLKGVKKKDSIELVIEKDSETKMSVKRNKNINTFVIQEAQKNKLRIYDYDENHCISVISKEFTTMLKDLDCPKSKNITIISNGNYITFYSTNGIIDSKSTLGNVENEITNVEFLDEENKEENGDIEKVLKQNSPINGNNIYNENFDFHSISKLKKIAGSSKQVAIYLAHGNPIKFVFHLFTNALLEVFIFPLSKT